MFGIITDVKSENFLFGGLVYHHKEILDEEERDKQFQNLVNESKGVDSKKYFGDGETKLDSANDIYSLMATLKNIKKSQSLSKFAMNKTLKYFSNEPSVYPIEYVYSASKHENSFIDNSVKIIKGDIIIFIPFTGLLGAMFDKNREEQEFAIIYNYDKRIGINIGHVFDYKLIKDYLNYKNVVGDMNE